jgi:hypothetical protein
MPRVAALPPEIQPQAARLARASRRRPPGAVRAARQEKEAQRD